MGFFWDKTFWIKDNSMQSSLKFFMCNQTYYFHLKKSLLLIWKSILAYAQFKHNMCLIWAIASHNIQVFIYLKNLFFYLTVKTYYCHIVQHCFQGLRQMKHRRVWEHVLKQRFFWNMYIQSNVSKFNILSIWHPLYGNCLCQNAAFVQYSITWYYNMHTAKQKLDLNGMGLILYNMASRHIYSRVSKTSDPSLTPVEVHLHERTHP